MKPRRNFKIWNNFERKTLTIKTILISMDLRRWEKYIDYMLILKRFR